MHEDLLKITVMDQIHNMIQAMDELDGDVTEYVDDGHTGTNFNRPAFQAMVEDAKRGKIDVILVKDLSRIGRDYIGVGDYLEQIFPILGVFVNAFVNQGILGNMALFHGFP